MCYFRHTLTCFLPIHDPLLIAFEIAKRVGNPTESRDMHKRIRDKVIAVGIKLAFKSNMKMRHGAVITSATGKIVATGYNKRLHNLHEAYSIHAEQSAVNNMYRNCKNLPRNSMLHLFVIRVLENGSLGNSAPCARCRTCIDNVRSIRKVFYSS